MVHGVGKLVRLVGKKSPMPGASERPTGRCGVDTVPFLDDRALIYGEYSLGRNTEQQKRSKPRDNRRRTLSFLGETSLARDWKSPFSFDGLLSWTTTSRMPFCEDTYR